MTHQTLIPAAVLIAVAILGAVALRRLSRPVRLGFDAISFLTISVFLLRQGVSPLLSGPNGPLSEGALWLRAVVGAWWLLGARVVVALLWFAFNRDRRSRATKLFSDLVAAVMYIGTAALVLNSVFALPVTGVLATSGVFAVVLGLALQNTLADVFAGIAVGIEAPFSVGDRIQIENGIEGQVVQVNWRSIRIQTDGGDVAVFPNSVVAKSEIINRSLPTQQRTVSIELECPADSDSDRVIEILLQSTLLCSGILQTPAPTAGLVRLGAERNAYHISFSIESTKYLDSQKAALLTHARRQLYLADLLPRTDGRTATAENPAERPSTLSADQLMTEMTLFECLSQAQLRRLAQSTASSFLEPGEQLFSQGASDATLYMLATGVVKLELRTDASEPTVVGNIGAGDYIGELGLFTGEPQAVTAIARTPCHVYRLSHDAIAPLLAESPELVAAFEMSVRRGLERLHRGIAAHGAAGVVPKEQLLERIRSFFRSG